jgi:hypothetical protein
VIPIFLKGSEMMTASDATMLYYRGYLIESRFAEGPAITEWTVLRSAPSGDLEEVGILSSESAARKLIDELTAPARAR